MKTVDAFGDIRFDGRRLKGRLIQTGPTTYAVFPADDPKNPFQVTAAAAADLRGRNLAFPLQDGSIFEFRRAGCGCQTPNSLRGPQSRFLAQIPAPAEP